MYIGTIHPYIAITAQLRITAILFVSICHNLIRIKYVDLQHVKNGLKKRMELYKHILEIMDTDSSMEQ